MPRPRTRIETASHANDPEITMIRYRRGPDNPVWEAQIALPDRTKKIVSTRETDVMKAQFAAVWLKQQITGQLMATGTAELRKPRMAKASGPTFEVAARQAIADIELQRQTIAMPGAMRHPKSSPRNWQNIATIPDGLSGSCSLPSAT